ncbi:hypothetical protein M407DRAFT_205066 [Tulasnella calospora MUT 4182]|uniref:Uncharacterized protein n=1 Tax=Tulasnella calospora MUT 4182 TaxID=1051891 RepID=A0A0C3MHL7_9AGAM|nr:hypothetical protein M407DRAFT_205066 [Tulasnella calospora MUT 4182]
MYFSSRRSYHHQGFDAVRLKSREAVVTLAVESVLGDCRQPRTPNIDSALCSGYMLHGARGTDRHASSECTRNQPPSRTPSLFPGHLKLKFSLPKFLRSVRTDRECVIWVLRQSPKRNRGRLLDQSSGYPQTVARIGLPVVRLFCSFPLPRGQFRVSVYLRHE